MKLHLNACMESQNSKNWVSMLPAYLQHYNSQVVPGTTYRRKDINASNFSDFMSQKTGVPNFENFMSTQKVDGESIKNKAWLKKLFAYELGQKVYIAAKLSPGQKTGAFYKATSKGYFNTRDIFKIKKRYLTTTNRLTLLQGTLPYNVRGANNIELSFFTAYKLVNIQGGPILRGVYYERELRPAPKDSNNATSEEQGGEGK